MIAFDAMFNNAMFSILTKNKVVTSKFILKKISHNIHYTLIIANNINHKIDKLPDLIYKLKLGSNFNSLVNNLPSSIKILIFSNRFNQTVDYLPNSIIKIVLGGYFNQSIDLLPNSIITITLSKNYYEYSTNSKTLIYKINIYFINLNKKNCYYNEPINTMIYNI